MIILLKKKNIGDWIFEGNKTVIVPFIAYTGRNKININKFFIEAIHGSQPDNIKLNIDCKDNGGNKFLFQTFRVKGDVSKFFLIQDNKNRQLIGGVKCCEVMSRYVKKNNIKYGDKDIVSLYIRVIEVK